VLGPVTGITIHFYPDHFNITWLPPFSLIPSDIAYCLTALDRHYVPLVAEQCALDEPRYKFDRLVYNQILMVAVSPANKLGPGSRKRYKLQGSAWNFIAVGM